MKIKNITLIRCDPRNSNTFATFAHPGLALPLIGTVLKDAGYNVQIYIDCIQPPTWEDIKNSDMVGFYVSCVSFLETYELADRIKKEIGCLVVMGGPHVSTMPDEALQHCDYAVRSEGEEIILEMLDAFKSETNNFKDMKGLSWRDSDNVVHHNPKRPLLQNLDLIPDFSLIAGFEAFNRQFSQKIFPTGMMLSTSRGCPFPCSFCTIPYTYGRDMRYRSHDAIIADIKQQIKFSKRNYFFITDDNFTGNLHQTKRLLKRLIKDKIKIRFSAEIRCDTITKDKDHEFLDLLKEAGCYLVHIGFESINDKSLKFYNKGGKQSKEIIEKSIVELRKRDILVHGMFIIGADTDESGTAMQTAQWALEQKLDSLQLLPLCPLPGTGLTEKLEREGRIFKKTHPISNTEYVPYGGGNYVLFQPMLMNAIDLQKEIYEAYKFFYSTGHIFNSMKDIFSTGLTSVIVSMIGKSLVSKAEPEIREHIEWLSTLDPKLTASPYTGKPKSENMVLAK